MCVESAPALLYKMMDYQKQSQVRMMAEGESPLEISCRRLSPHCYDQNVEAEANLPVRSPPPTEAPVLNSTPVNPFRTCSPPSDAPIDLSQLSTRRMDPTKRLASDARSASESCLALGRKKFRLDEKGNSSGHPLGANPTQDGRFPHWRITNDGRIVDSAQSSDLLKQRSMSSADLCAYGNVRLNMEVEARLERREVTPQPEPNSWNHIRKSSASPASPSTTSPPSSSKHTSPPDDMQLKYVLQRCMSDSRLAGILPSTSNLYSDLQRNDPDEDGPEECLLRRTASESIIPSRSPEAAAMEVMKRQQQLIQQHYQQFLQQQVGGEGSPPDPSSYLANPWLYLQLFGYSHMLQSFQAQEYLKKMTNAQIHPVESGSASGQVSAGPSSPVPSPSGSDEDPAGSAGLNGNKRRSPRALTGKHVRLGTGASPTTLHTLRLKIEERQKLQKLKSLPKGSNWSAGNGAHSSNSGKKITGKVKGRAK